MSPEVRSFLFLSSAVVAGYFAPNAVALVIRAVRAFRGSR